MKIALPIVAAALALALPRVADAAVESHAATPSKPISCLTYLAQFEGAVVFRPGATRMPQAERLAEKGRKACLAGDERAGRVALMAALREIGVTPKGATAPSPVTIEQEARTPGAKMAPNLD